MPELREIIEVRRNPQDAFEAVADFSGSAQWDPGVLSAERFRDGEDTPCGVGAQYRLRVSFRGHASEMTYRTTEYARPHRVVFEGIGPRVAATDTIEFEPLPQGGTRITYIAHLRLIGLAKVAEPFFGGAFDEMGKRAIQGMKAWLDEPPAHAAP